MRFTDKLKTKMITDAFADVDPHHPGMVVALEPERCSDSKEISLLRTTRSVIDWTSFPWMDVVLDQDSLGELAYRSLLIEARQHRLPGSQMYSVVRNQNMLKASMRAGVKGVIIESPVSGFRHARGYFQRIDAAQEDIIGRYGQDNLKKAPVLVYHAGSEGNLEALLRLKEEGLIVGCVDATEEGTLSEAYDQREHPDFMLLRSVSRIQSWLAWNRGVLPIVHIPDLDRVLKFAVAGDRWYRYEGTEVEKRVPVAV